MQECVGFKAASGHSRWCGLLLPFSAALVVILAKVAPQLAAKLLAPCDLQQADYVLLKVQLHPLTVQLCVRVVISSIFSCRMLQACQPLMDYYKPAFSATRCLTVLVLPAADRRAPLLNQRDNSHSKGRLISLSQDTGELSTLQCITVPTACVKHRTPTQRLLLSHEQSEDWC